NSVVVGDGPGVIVVAQRLPIHFEVVEGSNLNAWWKGRQEKTLTLSCRVRYGKRGLYSVPALEWEIRHPFDLVPPKRGSAGVATDVTVGPRILNVRAVRAIPSLAHNPFPDVDTAKIGIPTTDFREIRQYVHGDPIRSINWKATARRARTELCWPLVNEYEAEGKKTVWIFLDGSTDMLAGTSTENVMEYAVEATNALAFYFLDRGYRTGLCIFNGDGSPLYPDSGKRQFFRINRELVRLRTADRFDELPRVIEKSRANLLGCNPVCIIVTRLDSRHSDSVVEATKRIRSLRSKWSRRQLPVVAVSVAGYHVVQKKDPYEENAAAFIHWQTRHVTDALEHLGAYVLEWNPRQERFATVLMRQMGDR
ncbi:MAG: DUF58 domain-containing protein, partial [Chloroflexi bacterium]|nr:DUF58 domain-containing protein [Chloroflexota bacterium]